jgi:hypothetical protein
VTLYSLTIPGNTANAGLVNCGNSPSSTLKAVGGGAVPNDLNNTTNPIIASYAVFGSNIALPPNGSTNANGWRVTWTVFVLCAT